jgi:hypothetical protein
VYRAAFELMTGLSLDPRKHPFLERTRRDTDPTLWSDEDVGELRKFLDEYRLPIDLGRRAAHMAHCRFMPQFLPTGVPMVMDQLADMRDLARLLLLDSLLRLHDGDADGALRGCTTAFLLARSLEENPELITFLVRLVLPVLSFQSAELVLDQADPSPQAIGELLATVRDEGEHLRAGLVQTFVAERVIALSTLGQTAGLQGPPSMPTASQKAAPVTGQPVTVGWYGKPFMRSLITGDLETVPRALEIARADYVDARLLMDALKADAAEWQKHYLRNYSRVLVALAVPAWVRTKEDETKGEARLAVAEVALGLKLYRGEHGQYPDSLDALSPAFLPVIPADPCTGKPLVYVRQGEGFLVYGIGLNGKDDGGITMTWEDSKMVNPDTDDVAWRARR